MHSVTHTGSGSRLLSICVALASLWAAAPVFAQGDVDAGRVKAWTCSGCHASEAYKNIYPTYSVPKLRGQSAAYIAAALKAYRAGERPHPTMRAQAGSMTDEDIADIAAYIASLGVLAQ
jgi:cytochrome c553